jgi:uncharacterized membrane protein
VRAGLALALLLAAAPAWAELPALFGIAGPKAQAPAIHIGPDTHAPVLERLTPAQGPIEVTAYSDDGRWGRVNTGEQSGWVEMSRLAPLDLPGWETGEMGLACLGTEPFWSLLFFLPSHRAEFHTPDNGGVELGTDAGALPATRFPTTLAIPFSGTHEGMAVVRQGECSDGMSDNAFGLEAQVYFRGDTAGLSGCCRLAP